MEVRSWKSKALFLLLLQYLEQNGLVQIKIQKNGALALRALNCFDLLGLLAWKCIDLKRWWIRLTPCSLELEEPIIHEKLPGNCKVRVWQSKELETVCWDGKRRLLVGGVALCSDKTWHVMNCLSVKNQIWTVWATYKVFYCPGGPDTLGLM